MNKNKIKNNKFIEKGKLNLVLGCMFSGKTSELLNRYNKYNIAKKKCLLIKYKDDTRYDEFSVVTHNNIKIPAKQALYLHELDAIVDSYQVVCVDEIQFFKDAPIYCDLWANRGIIVEVCGLNGTFERLPFDTISKLIPMCDNITFLKAICIDNGTKAIYSRLKQNKTNQTGSIIIGGDDMYSAADRKEYFTHNSYDNYLLEKFINFCEIVCKKDNLYCIIKGNLDFILENIDKEVKFMKIIKKLNEKLHIDMINI